MDEISDIQSAMNPPEPRSVSPTGAGRMWLKFIFVPFAVQVCILLMVLLVENAFDQLRVLLWPASFLVPYVLQVRMIYRAPVLRRLSNRLLRSLSIGFICFLLTLTGLVVVLFLQNAANLGMLGD